MPSGNAAFIQLCMIQLKNARFVKEQLKKNDVVFKLVLNVPEFKPAALLEFKNQTIYVSPISDQDVNDKSKWDAKMTTDGVTLFRYFLGELGTIKPLFPIIGKIKAAGMLKLIKLVWFVKITQQFYSENTSFARAVFDKMYLKT